MNYQAFDDYQEWAKSKAVYIGESDIDFMYPILGLASEVGEFQAVFKRMLRGDFETMDHLYETSIRDQVKKELGDILWYLAMCAYECELSLSEIVEANKEKLESREKRNTLKGSGDDR